MLATMSCGTPWMPALPQPTATLDQGDKQHLLWGYPSIVWGGAAAVVLVPIFWLMNAATRKGI